MGVQQRTIGRCPPVVESVALHAAIRVLALLFLLAFGFSASSPALAQPTFPCPAAAPGFLLTMSGTAQHPDPDNPAAGSLLVQLTLDRDPESTVSGLSISVPLPPHTGVRGAPARARILASRDGRRQALAWNGISIGPGERLGPLSFELVPATGEDGAGVFRDAAIEPLITWSDPRGGYQPSPQSASGRRGGPTGALRLNGLWGEDQLRRTLLPNGLTVFTRERPDTRTVSVRMAVRAGSRDEDEVTRGGSHWLEHAHFLGTTTRSGSLLDAEISAVGAQSNASTGFEHTDYWHLVPAEHFELAIEVLADMMLNSTFPPDAFERERLVVFEELKTREDTPRTLASDEFIRLVFQVSPLAQHPAGTIESVQSIPIETILAYRDQHYVTGNMAIAVVGAIRHDDAVASVATAFAGLPRGGSHLRPSTPEPVQAARRTAEIGAGAGVAEVRLGWPAPGDFHPDSAAMAIVDDLLGTTGRRLSEEIRDRRALATSVGPSYFAFSDAGAFMVAASTRPELVGRVVELVLAEIERLRAGEVTEHDIQASLRATAGQRSLADELNQAQTRRAVGEVIGNLESYAEWLARLRRVTPADVQRVAREYLDPENYTLVVVRA